MINTNLKNAFALSAASLTTFKNTSIDVSQNDLIILTAAGTISGTFIPISSKENDIENDIEYKLIKAIHSNALEVCKDPDKVILLKDVTLLTATGFNQFFKYLHVFTDDIIAITIGNVTDHS